MKRIVQRNDYQEIQQRLAELRQAKKERYMKNQGISVKDLANENKNHY